MPIDKARTIRDWFAREWGGTLLLPDGWYGRPYDNQHALTGLDERDDQLTLELDARLKLVFRGLKTVTLDGKDLVLRDFESLIFDWRGVGPGASGGRKEYSGGEVKIMAGLG